MKLSTRIETIEGSKTARFIPLLEQMKRDGRSVISLAIGEPEFDTPAPVIDATRQALNRQRTRYGAVGGLASLRSALAEPLDGYTHDNIAVFNGSKQALFAIFQTICDPGDQVIIPAPCWVSFVEQVRLAGGEPRLVGTLNHQLDVAAIEAAINPRTRAILINSPNNPTGAVYPRHDLERVARLALDHDLFLIADEAYEFFVYDDLAAASLVDLAPVRDRLIVTRSFSKHYAMTGFRIGYALAPAEVIAAMIRLQSHMSGNVCTFAQYGALAALRMDPALMVQRRDQLQRQRDLAWDLVSPLFPCVRPQGAFYLFPDVSGHLAPHDDSEAFARRLLERAGVAVVPGGAFGMEGHVRICFAVPQTQLREAFDRIREVL